MRTGLIVLLLMVVACGSSTPSVDTWLTESWEPVASLVPEPSEATPAVCDHVLGDLRTFGSLVRPAPFPELGDVADAWVGQAENLMFDCAADLEDFDYETEYEHLTRLQAEVEALVDQP